MALPKSIELAVKQLRQAANNLQIESSDATSSWKDTARAGSMLCNRIANALEMGPSYLTEPIAKDFDTANEREK